MFKKEKISFRNKVIFDSDFKASIDRAFCVVAKMLFDGRVNVDGSINVEQVGYLRKYQLWSYIYYLYHHNHSIVEEFSNMMNPENGKVSASRMYEEVRRVVNNPTIPEGSVLPFDVNSLIYFINIMVHKYKMDMMNPVVNYLQQLLSNRDAISKLQSFTLVTGRSPNEVEVITDPERIANSDIKVRVVERANV